MSSKRKFVVFLVLVVALMCSSLASAADPVAIIVDFEKVEDGLTIERADSDSGGKTALLYPSDKISGSNLSQVTVRCGPYAKCVSVGDGVFQVVYDPPSVITSVTEAVVNKYFGYWSSVEDFYLGSSRGATTAPVLDVCPGNSSTVLPGTAIRFSVKNIPAGELVIKNREGKVVYDKHLNAGSGLTPAQLGLTPGQKYTWKLGASGEYSFTVLDAEAAKQVVQGLTEIDRKSLASDHKMIWQAAFLQVLSDSYPKTYDLYWLSGQLANQVKDSSLDGRKVLILTKCQQHLLKAHK